MDLVDIHEQILHMATKNYREYHDLRQAIQDLLRRKRAGKELDSGGSQIQL